MENNLDRLMLKNIICENRELSQLIEDIVPKMEQRYTNIELDANKNETFSLVVYKKQTLFTRVFKAISIALEKFRIMKNLRKFDLNSLTDINNK